jgi:hypothetical protein
MNKTITWILILILLVTPILAQTYEQDEPLDIKAPCMNNGTYCSASATCNVTIFYPNSTTLINNELMTNNQAYHNYSLTEEQTNILGEYEVTIMCQDGTIYGYSTYNYKITPTGEEPSTSEGILYIGIFAVLLIFFILCIYGLITLDNLFIRFAILHISYLLIVAITFISQNIANNFITNAPFLISFSEILWKVFMIGYFPFLVGSVCYLFYMVITIKEIRDMIDKGIPEDEAVARRGNKRW